MENYHIYDEIGRGKYSVVYKARRKKSVDYVAVKSTEKGRMEKVLNEVQLLHKLNHMNVIKFHNWYESRNHIWIIFEYCTGGDLLNLITQDKTLPEKVVQSFGRDLLCGLYYLHSRGILFCDMKPSNILIDEYGALKLADFGLARPIPMDESSLQQLGLGSPHYLAPELFHQPALHSFASDLWALGCILYELRVGLPPFVHQTFTKLVAMIQSEEIELPPPGVEMSDEFVNLLQSLLQKNPRNRLSWEKLRVHPFWMGVDEIPKLVLPDQPLVSVFFPSTPTSAMTEQLYEEVDQKLFQHGKENVAPEDYVDEVRDGSVSVRQSDTSTEGMNKSKDRPNLSIIVRRSTQRRALEDDDDLYRKPSAEIESHEVELLSPDSRIDFDFAAQFPDEKSECAYLSDEELKSDQKPREGWMEVDQPKEEKGVFEHEEEVVEKASAKDTAERLFAVKATSDDDMDLTGDELEIKAEAKQFRPQSAPIHKISTEQEQYLNQPVDISNVPKTAPIQSTRRMSKEQALVMDIARITDNFRRGVLSDDTAWKLSFSCPFDTLLKPIVCNKEIEIIPIPPVKEQLLTMSAISATELLQLETRQLEKHLGKIHHVLASSSTSSPEKLNLLAYLYTLCLSSKSANLLINSSLLILFIKLLQRHSSVQLKSRLCLIIGLLIRFATYIAPETGQDNNGILQALTILLRESDERVRRRSVAALGELLFYISTLETDTDSWNIPGNTITSFIQCLNDTDQIVQHYTLKTICNIFIHSKIPKLIDRFQNENVFKELITLMQQELSPSSRSTCAMTISHFLRHAERAHTLNHYLGILFLQSSMHLLLISALQGTPEKTTEGLYHGGWNFLIYLFLPSTTTLKTELHLFRMELIKLRTFNELICQTIDPKNHVTTAIKGKVFLLLYWILHDTKVPLCLPCVGQWQELHLMSHLMKILSKQEQLFKDPFYLQTVLHFIIQFVATVMDALHLTTSEDPTTALPLLFGILSHPFLRKQLRKYFQQHDISTFQQFWVDLGNAMQGETREEIYSVLFALSQHLIGFLTEINLPEIEKTLFQHFYPVLLEQFITNVDTIKLTYQFLAIHYQLSTEKRNVDTFVIQSILPLYLSLFRATPSFLTLHFGFKVLCLILYTNSTFTGIFHRLGLIEPMLHYQHDQISPFYTFCIKLMIESNEITLATFYDWDLVPCILHVLHQAEQQHLTLCLIHCFEIIYYLLYSTSQQIREKQGDVPVLLVQIQELLKSTNTLIRLTATQQETTDQEQLFPFGEISKSSESMIPLAELTTRCILLMGQLYGAKFYDVLFQVKTTKRPHLRFMDQALTHQNEIVKLKLLRTIRHALRSRAPLNYIYIITHRKSTLEQLQQLSQNPQLEIASVANEIKQLIQSNTS